MAVRFDDIGLAVPQVMVPKKEVDMQKWCVIACDQYTSEPAYWKRVEETVGDSPSMLNLIYPEVYLNTTSPAEYIQKISATMETYLKNGVLEEKEPGFVLVDRKTPSTESRKGLVVALDLELYDFAPKSRSLIRATEKTIEERLPARIAVREKAPIESPHILVLIDDPERTVIEPLFEKRAAMNKLYDFDLMEGSGHMTGHHVTKQEDIEQAVGALRAMGAAERFRKRYDAGEDEAVILFPVGDGNHSLATAKRCWEALKKQGAPDDHPARHALVELVNIHDTGLDFHPIYRLVEKVDVASALTNMESFFQQQGWGVEFTEGAKLSKETTPGVHKFECVSQGKSGVYTITNVTNVLEVKTLDTWLNTYLAEHKECEMDYVHEAYTIEGKSKGSGDVLGFLLPIMHKDDLVKTVVKEGMLPRKTFSMGHAPEKRFYCECKKV